MEECSVFDIVIRRRQKSHYLILTPDIHQGTRADMVSSLLYMNQSIYLYSNRVTLPEFHKNVFYEREFNGKSSHVYIPSFSRVKRLPYQSYAIDYFIQNKATMMNDRLFRESDVIMCMFYPFNCLNYKPFNKILLFNAAHRFFIKYCNYDLIMEFIKMIQGSTRNESNVLFYAGGEYDQAYIYYFTGVYVSILYSTSVFSIQSFEKYSPIYDDILVAPLKLKSVPSYLLNACIKANCRHHFTVIKRAAQGMYSIDSIHNYKAVVILPYAVLSYYLCDIIATAMPLFVPSPEFLYDLRLIHDYRARDSYYCGANAHLPPRSENCSFTHNPEADHYMSESGRQSFLFWIKKASFYTPDAIQFSSWNDLFEKLSTTDYKSVYERNRQYNKRIKQHNIAMWESIFHRVDELKRSEMK